MNYSGPTPKCKNSWGTDLAGMHLLSNHNKGITFLICVTDIHIYNKYVCFTERQKCYYSPQKFLKNLDEFGRKLNKIWVDQGSEVYNRSMKS